MQSTKFILACLLICTPMLTLASGKVVETPYQPQKVVFDFYFDHPLKISSALYWLRTLVNTLSDDPYAIDAESNSIKVVIHGTEIITLVTKNYEKYRDAVDRMRYYASIGVEFKVCKLAAQDFGYQVEDFQDFVQLVPSAMNEVAHWQNHGYALIAPIVTEKRYTIEEIR